MAKGYDKHYGRVAEINALGRKLARRSGSACEICTTAGVPLRGLEVLPLPEEPVVERCVFTCEVCRDGIVSNKLADRKRWRFLESTVWSDVPAVQVAAVRLLRRLAEAEMPWAQDTLEGLYLDPDIEAWVDEA